MMRRSIVVLVSLVLMLASFLSLSRTAAAESEPELAIIRSTETLVHSGPGNEFYATGRLDKGERVEIYRQKKNGWCAIRPPKGSFSYVRADSVQETASPQVLEVTRDGIKTRVGSTLTQAYQVEYVSLKQGETLERIDGPVRLGRNRHAWYRIAPPSGEFRWIHRRDLHLASGNQRSEATTAIQDHMQHSTASLALPAAKVPAPKPGADHSAKNDLVNRPSPKPVAPEQAVSESTAPDTEAKDLPKKMAASPIPLQKLVRPRGQMKTEPIPQRETANNVALATHEIPIELTNASSVETSRPAKKTDEPSAWTAVDTQPLEAPGVAAPGVAAPGVAAPGVAAPGVAAPNMASSVLADTMHSGTPRTTQNQHPFQATNQRLAREPNDADIRLAELELALSRMVTQEVDRWNLEPLRQGALQIAAAMPDVNGRRNAHIVLERIEEFASLQRRHYRLSTPTDEERGRIVSLASAIAERITPRGLSPAMANLPPDPPNRFLAREAAIRRQAEENVHFAGTGWLVPVITSRTDLPRFALADAEGSILAFVSAHPGLNLRRYQRHEVGVVGRETSPTDDNMSHLIAERIVILERHKR